MEYCTSMLNGGGKVSLVLDFQIHGRGLLAKCFTNEGERVIFLIREGRKS